MKSTRFVGIVLFALLLTSAFISNAQFCNSNFIYSVDGLTVEFEDSSSANSTIISYSWDFGDGDTSSAMNPTHTYLDSGAYPVCLTIEDLSRCVDTYCDTVYVQYPIFCAADFDYWIDTNNTVLFTSNVLPISTVGPSYSWDFGDGTALDTNANPSHSYDSTGAYLVTLSVITSVGDSCQYSDTVFVNECFLSVTLDTILKDPTSTSYEYTVSSYYTNLDNVGNLPQGNVTFSWDFGNGTGTTQNSGPFKTTATYSSSGSYTIMHEQHDSITNNVCSYSETINVVVNCSSGFQSQVNLDTVHITNTATNFTNLVYYFGDGDSSFLENPSHVYKVSGTYYIEQLVYDTLHNCVSSSIDSVNVIVPIPPCSAGFSVLIRNDSVDFTNTASSYETLIYDFGDGTTSTNANPTHIYTTSGPYQVCQTVFDSTNNCIDSICQTISIVVPDPCEADFSYSALGDSIAFTNNSANYDRLEYDFGDGNTSSEEDPFHLYASSGTYTVTLVAYNDARNCSDTLKKTITVSISTSCFADFEVAIDTSKSNLLFLINFSSNHPNHEYSWTFGDGGTGTGRTPSHQYEDYGKYEICLTVSDSVMGCTSTYCDSLGLDSNSNVLKANGYNLRVIDGRPIGIEENILESQLSIYPNPVNEILHVNLPQTDLKISYRLFDMNGRSLQEGNLNGRTGQIDFNGLTSGIYLIQFTDGRNVAVKRAIKR